MKRKTDRERSEKLNLELVTWHGRVAHEEIIQHILASFRSIRRDAYRKYKENK